MVHATEVTRAEGWGGLVLGSPTSPVPVHEFRPLFMERDPKIAGWLPICGVPLLTSAACIVLIMLLISVTKYICARELFMRVF